MDWDWVNSLDWGNAPSWVTAGAAVTAVVIARRNLRTAREAYVDDVWQRKVAQARLVWAVRGRYCGRSAGSNANPAPRKSLGLEKDLRVVGDRPDDYELGEIDGKPESVLTVSATYFVFRVTNNSNEPIGRVRLMLSGSWAHGPDGYRRPEGAERTWTAESRPNEISVIPPKTTVERIMFVRADMRDIKGRKARATVIFTDSAGITWKRRGTGRPQEVERPQHAPARRGVLTRVRLRNRRRSAS